MSLLLSTVEFTRGIRITWAVEGKMNQTFALMPLCTNASKLPKVSAGQSFVVHFAFELQWEGKGRRKGVLAKGRDKVRFYFIKKSYPFISHFLYDNVKTEKIKIRSHPP